MTEKLSFIGGAYGQWEITSIKAIAGEGLKNASRLHIVNQDICALPANSSWLLRSFASHIRYATKAELTHLKSVSPPLSRNEATIGVLIPIKKSQAWWEMAQDERREIFEEQSHHTAIGLDYLPGVARRLLHCRDLGEAFDFLTWFEFAPEHAPAFAHLLARLRATKEWEYVEREVEIYLNRDKSWDNQTPIPAE